MPIGLKDKSIATHTKLIEDEVKTPYLNGMMTRKEKLLYIQDRFDRAS